MAGDPRAPTALVRDAAALVRVPSVTGDERRALECVVAIADSLGLQADMVEHDLERLRGRPRYPGEEADRTELWGAVVTRPGQRSGGPRLCLDGHVDVVAPGAAPWAHGPWSGALDGGFLHGRGSVDMKGAVVAAVHAMARARTDAEVVLLAVAAEEDGGLGTFAALESDSRFDACLIPEPTEFGVVCAQAGALTFSGEVRGRAAHGAARLEGASAIDAYLPVHAALQAHEKELNEDVRHPLMRAMTLPYAVSVGRIHGGEWSSSVPDRLYFEGRLGVRLGETLDQAAEALRARLSGHPVTLEFQGARFASGETAADHPFTVIVRDAFGREGRIADVVGVPYGADMRLFCERGIPCVMAGTAGFGLAHAVDERVAVADLERLALSIERVIEQFGRPHTADGSTLARWPSPA